MAGAAAEKSLHDTVVQEQGKYIAVVEGSIPLADNGVYCTIGGRSTIDIAKEVCSNAYATIAVGTCAAFGGIPAVATRCNTTRVHLERKDTCSARVVIDVDTDKHQYRHQLQLLAIFTFLLVATGIYFARKRDCQR
jgi:Ni,Fe-hydrogenase I small subunit